MDRRGWAWLLGSILLGLGLGAFAGFMVGLLRPHEPSTYTPAYIPPPAATDQTISVDQPVNQDA